MMFSEPLSQYEEILKDAIRTSMKESGAKLAKIFQTLLIEILTLYMILPRKINFTQMARYGKHGEQTYRQNFNRKKKDCIDWLLLNLLAKTEHSHPLGMVVSTHFRCGKGVKRGLKNGALPFKID